MSWTIFPIKSYRYPPCKCGKKEHVSERKNRSLLNDFSILLNYPVYLDIPAKSEYSYTPFLPLERTTYKAPFALIRVYKRL